MKNIICSALFTLSTLLIVGCAGNGIPCEQAKQNTSFLTLKDASSFKTVNTADHTGVGYQELIVGFWLNENVSIAGPWNISFTVNGRPVQTYVYNSIVVGTQNAKENTEETVQGNEICGTQNLHSYTVKIGFSDMGSDSHPAGHLLHEGETAKLQAKICTFDVASNSSKCTELTEEVSYTVKFEEN